MIPAQSRDLLLLWDMRGCSNGTAVCSPAQNVMMCSSGVMRVCRMGKLFSFQCIHVILGVVAVCMCTVNICALNTFRWYQWCCFCCAIWQVF